MDWAGGYVADIGYTAGFYRETAPAHLAFAALAAGRSPGRALKPKRLLELGFGQGFGLGVLAAANPDVAFDGIDFNPEHVAHARRLVAAAGLENLALSEASFEEAAARGGESDADVVALHGIFSWVARDTQDAIVQVIRQRLQPDGLAYVSYNSMPGWAPLAPIRQLMLATKRRHPGGSDRQLGLALELVASLRQGGAAYFSANPAAAQHVDAMLAMDRVYLAHEYLDAHWDLFEFADLAARLGEAKLSFVASATLPENVDAYAVPIALQPLVAQAGDIVLRETLRDYAANKRFRRDVFARGSAALTAAEQRRLLSRTRFALAVPRARVTFQFAGPLEMLTGHEALYAPVVDILAERNAGFDELLALPAYGEERLGMLLDCLSLLVHSGQVMPLVRQDEADPGPAQRFNRMVVENARAGRLYFHLASPVARTGLPVSDFGLLTLAAFFAGEGQDGERAARHALGLLKAIGRRPLKDGRLIEDDGEATAFLTANMKPVIDDFIPVWRKLGAI